MDLALIDFDGTITTKGVYADFLRFAVPFRRQLTAGILLSPLIAGYKCGLISDPAIRKVLSRASFLGDDPGRVQACGERFARDVLPGVTRPIALLFLIGILLSILTQSRWWRERNWGRGQGGVQGDEIR